MKHLSRLLAGALLVSLTACSSDEPTPGTGGETTATDPLYSTITIKSTLQSRSTEGNEGNEIGKDNENTVSAIFVVLATKADDGSFKYLSFAENDSKLNNNQHVIVFKNKHALLELANNTEPSDREVYVFAYCNPTSELKAKISALTKGDDFTDEILTERVTSTWSPDYFLMTSVDKTNKATLPESEVLKTYNTVDNPFNLGTIEVVRTASRFDFKDVSNYVPDGQTERVPFTYSIKDYLNQDKEIATVTLDQMAVFNQRSNFYYLPRTKATAANDAIENLCPGWIGMSFDQDSDGKWVNPFIVSPSTQSYNYQLTPGEEFDETSLDNWKKLSDVCKEGNEDNINENTKNDNFLKNYYIFDYTSENTIVKDYGDGDFDVADGFYPSGVVFRAEIKVKGGKNLDNNGNAQTMYIYDNVLYYSAKEVYDNVSLFPNSPMYVSFYNCFDVTGSGETAVVTEKENAPLKDNKFTAYRPNADGKYYCYYFYYNQHVDDEDSSVIGKMEYATVRNNVYKLAVNNIKRLGTTEIPTPGHWDIYFKVTVQVRDWVVRVNDKIEF